MYVRFEDYIFPEGAFATIGTPQNNKRYVNITMEILGLSMTDLQCKIDEILEGTNATGGKLYIANDDRYFNVQKEQPAAYTYDTEDGNNKAVVTLKFMAEDKYTEEDITVNKTYVNGERFYVESNNTIYPKLTISFSGSSPYLYIRNSNTDQDFAFEKEIAAGSEVVIDSSKMSIEINGVPQLEESESAEYITFEKGVNFVNTTGLGITTQRIEYVERFL